MMPVRDLMGGKFGRLTVIERAATQGRLARWLCKCDCGGTKIVVGARLTSGQTRSCGCLQKEQIVARSARHGMHGSCEYTCYQAAKNRCNNPNNKDFGNYGERGIKFLYESFEEFFADLGPRPPGLTVDRIDNNGHYEPGNCRWTTQLVQQNNRRGNRPVTIGERTRSVADWAREFSINPDMARNRLRRGWSIEAALTRNPQTGRRRKLTPNLVRAIRADFHSGLKNKAGLGRKYGASPAAISDLLTGRTHRHVT